MNSSLKKKFLNFIIKVRKHKHKHFLENLYCKKRKLKDLKHKIVQNIKKKNCLGLLLVKLYIKIKPYRSMEPMRQIDPEGPATEFVNYPEAPEDDEDDDDHYLVEDESDYHFDDEEDEVDGWERCMRPIGMIRKPKSVVRYPTLKLHDYNRSKVKSRFFSINIKCSQNNVFCVLTDFFTGKNLCSYSSGTYGIKISRKTVRYNIKTVLTYFFRQIKKQMSNAEILIFILTIPINSKKNILSFIFSQLDKTDNKVIFFVLKNLKCFNGCRLKKKKRKKHKIRRFLDV